jgi:hypothetical protein
MVVWNLYMPSESIVCLGAAALGYEIKELLERSLPS